MNTPAFHTNEVVPPVDAPGDVSLTPPAVTPTDATAVDSESPVMPIVQPEYRSAEVERLLAEPTRKELDRRAQEELARQGAIAGKD